MRHAATSTAKQTDGPNDDEGGHASTGASSMKRQPKTTNRAILDGNFFLADLQRPPFSLPEPLRCVRTHPELEPDLTCLWLIDDAVRDSWLKRHGAKISMPKVIGDAEDGVSMLKVGGGARAVA